MAIDKFDRKAIVKDFLDWLPYSLSESFGDGGGINHDPDEVLNAYLASLIPCDTAVAFGPGHQSISECVRVGEHTNHVERLYDIEWTDADLRQTTVLGGQTFRLAFNDHGWM